jgi:tRNA nucleotidyltransferase (CCA-adding enzyme)
MMAMRYEELISLLREEDVAVIDFYRKDIAQLIPGFEVMFNYDQNHRAHQYDLWLHCCHTVVGLPKNIDDDMVYLAGLLHDIGKPYCQCRTTRGSSYVGHPARSMEIVRDSIIPAISSGGVGLSVDEIRRLLFYIRYHDCMNLKSLLNVVSRAELRNLVLLQIADAEAHIQLPAVERRILLCREFLGILEDIKGYAVHDDL